MCICTHTDDGWTIILNINTKKRKPAQRNDMEAASNYCLNLISVDLILKQA